MTSHQPLVSVVLTTRDRPRFLPIALACYQHQTYQNRELIVVDDGDRPADSAAVAAVGGRLIRVAPGTPIGLKLNRGLEEARGSYCQKMDDDDWYAPGYLESIVGAARASWVDVCRPTLAFLRPFLIFDVGRWEVRRSLDSNIPGATLFFARESWRYRPFRALRQNEDVWFYLDSIKSGVATLAVNAPETFLAIRHHGAGTDRGHTWTHYWNGATIEEHLQDRPLYPGGPEAILPSWAIARYRLLHDDLTARPWSSVERRVEPEAANVGDVGRIERAW